jgi:pyruvate dehydrogenase E2 component (dihydrolipoamide acetyltransferase)
MPADITLPDLGENIAEGGVLEIRVKPGDAVGEGDTVVVIEAEKSTVEVPAGVKGTIQEVLVKKGDLVKPGAVLARAEAGAAAPKAEPAKADAKAEPKPEKAAVLPRPSPGPGRNGDNAAPAPRFTAANFLPAGPATRRLARKLGIDLARVQGSGPRGRITQDDVIAFAQSAAGGPGPAAAPPLPDFARWGEVEHRPLEVIRRKTAEQMTVAWTQVPHVTQHDLADVTDLDAFRRAQEGEPKLTVTAFVLKACAVALRAFPHFNASLDSASNQLVVKRYIHIGVAVDTDRGLVVPVIRDADQKSIRQLAAELADVADRARHRKITVEDMRGGSFTVSNLGGIGGTAFTPIVNWPEVAILGLSRARLEPVVRDGGVVGRLMLPLSLSYDHRVIDGADGARFCRRIAAMLENPMLLLVDA